MSNLLKYIEDTNKVFTNKIIEIIRDDENWLHDLGISEYELKNSISIPNLIRNKISVQTNSKTIDLLLKYVISEYLINEDDDEIALIKHMVSIDSYGKNSALYVFKCSKIYLCYFYNDTEETLITEDPEAFCWNVAETIKEDFDLEENNLSEEWFKDSETFNDLQLNYNFNKT